MRCQWPSKSRLHLYALVFYAFACLAVLLIYVHFSTLPGLHKKPLEASDYKNRNYIDLLPIMDFEDLGRNKKKLQLLVLVSAAPGRLARRQGIRDTWWKHCSGNQVRCVFITDGFIVDDAQRKLIIQERNRYKDMELQPLLGWEFGPRFIKQIQWALAKFDFQYLLRIDDDYFLCLKRLLAELPMRPKENLIWGSFHCELGSTWIDESFMIFTPDIIQKFLSQNESTMLCHAHADQQIGLWINHMTSKPKFFHDSSLYHHPPASFQPRFKTIKNVCDAYLGVHGTYEELMRYLGQNASDGVKNVSTIPDFSSYCGTTHFDYKIFQPPFRYVPKLCKDHPRWNPGRKMYAGRESD